MRYAIQRNGTDPLRERLLDELQRAIEALPKDARFSVVVYSESYATWAGEMTAAKKSAKKKASAPAKAKKKLMVQRCRTRGFSRSSWLNASISRTSCGLVLNPRTW